MASKNTHSLFGEHIDRPLPSLPPTTPPPGPELESWKWRKETATAASTTAGTVDDDDHDLDEIAEELVIMEKNPDSLLLKVIMMITMMMVNEDLSNRFTYFPAFTPSM